MSTLVRQHWEANLGAFGGRRARQGFFYDAYVPDPIAELELQLPHDVAQVAAEAEEAIRALNRVPPKLGSLETLARQLLRAESVASSRIEGLELSHRRLAKASFAKDGSDLDAVSVLANMRAMEEAIRLSSAGRSLSVNGLRKIHRVLFGAFGDTNAGRLRTEQNWIGGNSGSPRDAEFVPPPPDRVSALLADLCEFLGRDDLPPVIQAAIAHAQFETIHPFADGNGRVGRCLIHVVLRRRGLAPKYVPPVSLILATDSKAYVAGLTDYRAGRVADWCGTFAAAVRTASAEAERFAATVESLQARWRAAAGEPRRDSAASRIIASLPAFPILDVASAEEIAS
ncbi:MAG: filamentation induced by cAMP protein Fic, partial [Myxococcaceae bacterium]|nr:filamentation induced by cAMP protein Fic [Myxococcaceae bacterium]